MVDDERTVEKVATFLSDVIDCAHNDEGDIIPEYVKTVNETVKAYAELKKVEADVEVARIKAESDAKIAKARATSEGIEGGLQALIGFGRIIYNRINMLSAIHAQEIAGMIVDKSYWSHVDKKS